MKTFWKIICLVGLLGLMASASLLENSLRMTPGIVGCGVSLLAFCVGGKLGGLMYE